MEQEGIMQKLGKLLEERTSKGTFKRVPHAMNRQPWYSSYYHAKSRCEKPHHPKYVWYGERGIKVDLAFWAMGVLWWRDKAEEMKSPTIDRIDNDGNYTFENCRFIERSENSRRRTITPGFRKKMSKLKTGNKNMLGKKHSEKTREKISKAHIGKVISEETRHKLREANLGKKFTEEHKRNMSVSLKRRFKTRKEEQKCKI